MERIPKLGMLKLGKVLRDLSVDLARSARIGPAEEGARH